MTTMRHALRHAVRPAAGLVAAAVLIAVPASALADAELRFNIKPAVEVDAKLKDKAPFIEVRVIGGGAPGKADEFTLTQEDGKPVPITIQATSIKKFTEGKETLGVVVVVEGQEAWMGNEGYVEENNPDRIVGVFSKLPAAIDLLKTAGPPSSMGALITYGAGAKIKHGMSDLSQLSGSKLGGQKDYVNQNRPDLLAALDVALTEINKATVSRKVLIIISDGQDTGGDQSRSQADNLKKKFTDNGVDVYAIYFNNTTDDLSPDLLGRVSGKDVLKATSMEEIAGKVGVIITSIQDRFYLVFPGADEKKKTRFNWDEKAHNLILKKGDTELGQEEVVLAPKWPVESGGSLWWLFLVIPIGLLAVAIIGVKLLGGKKQPEPVPVPVPVPVVPQPQPKMPTIMIQGVTGGDGYPMVGWIVPLNGPNQFQTFKLQGVSTKIGTGGSSQIVVNDGFMSTEHAQINLSSTGFVLQDGGSTNGVYVNERRVDRHELVDNDVITMGKTNFKFKSIN